VRSRHPAFKLKAVQIDQHPQQSLTFFGASRCDSKEGHISEESEGKGSPTHLHEHALPSKEGVVWKCSQCGWESTPMYFGEEFEPRHLCPNDSCGFGHRRSEHEHGFCTGAGITGETGSIDHVQEFCKCMELSRFHHSRFRDAQLRIAVVSIWQKTLSMLLDRTPYTAGLSTLVRR
jgi:hypothetical protein